MDSQEEAYAQQKDTEGAHIDNKARLLELQKEAKAQQKDTKGAHAANKAKKEFESRQMITNERNLLFHDLVKESNERFEAILNESNMFKQQYKGEQYSKWFYNERQIWLIFDFLETTN